jgi:hypothetical protein
VRDCYGFELARTMSPELLEKFKEAARDLETDDDPVRFKER